VWRAKNKGNKKMKKMIIAAAALIVAVASQAAVVDWSYTINKDKTVDSIDAAQASAYANNYMVYIFAANAAVADWSALTQDDLALALDSAALQYQTYGSRNGGTYSTANSLGVVGNARSIDVGDAASLAAKYVIVDTVNNTYVVTEATLESRAETAGVGSSGVIAITQTDFAGQTFSPIAVPEPTTGLLMLLGLAGLALRRRRA
jgi:hypothetical protein